ncbi:MAG: hypothetical protein NTZ12_05660 [Candidatus Aminicenantes bacterium]|nr:hypothetical protein [Candidatus Aminicenantes bacterium]
MVKTIPEKYLSLPPAIVLTVINGIFLYKFADWLFHGVDRPWDLTAYGLIVLPLIAFLAGIFMIVGLLRRASFWLILLAGIMILVVDVILLVFA